jgi:hypothetical protein
MCSPTAALAAQGAGAVNQSVGAYYSAASQKSQLRAQAAMAELNAAQSEKSAQQTLEAGKDAVSRQGLQVSRLKSRQVIGMAVNGIDLGSDSAVRALTDTDVMSELDKNAMTANAVRQAWGYRTQATDYRNQALTQRANASAISPGLAAATTLLGGATQVASSWYGMKNAQNANTMAQANASPDPMSTLIDLKGW